MGQALEDESLMKFLEAELASDFDVTRPDPASEEFQIATRDIFLCVSTGQQVSGSDTREVLAQRECRRIIYVAPPRPTPYEFSFTSTVVDFRQPDQWTVALNELKALLHLPYSKAGLLFDVPRLPVDYVDRPELSAALKAEVLQSHIRFLMIDGKPGWGKSTLAAAVARDCSVRYRFPNGIFWIYKGSSTEVSGDGRLFIFDYTVPTLRLTRAEGNSVVLYTKRPSFLDSESSSIESFSAPPWSLDELAKLARVDRPAPEMLMAANGSPAAVKLRLTVMSRYPGLENAELPPTVGDSAAVFDLAIDSFFAEPDVADAIQRLSIFVPDAMLAPAVYGRAFDASPSPEILRLLEAAGLIMLLPDQSIVIREGLGTTFQPTPGGASAA
jgi:hypothetical protein